MHSDLLYSTAHTHRWYGHGDRGLTRRARRRRRRRRPAPLRLRRAAVGAGMVVVLLSHLLPVSGRGQQGRHRRRAAAVAVAVAAGCCGGGGARTDWPCASFSTIFCCIASGAAAARPSCASMYEVRAAGPTWSALASASIFLSSSLIRSSVVFLRREIDEIFMLLLRWFIASTDSSTPVGLRPPCRLTMSRTCSATTRQRGGTRCGSPPCARTRARSGTPRGAGRGRRAPACSPVRSRGEGAGRRGEGEGELGRPWRISGAPGRRSARSPGRTRGRSAS